MWFRSSSVLACLVRLRLCDPTQCYFTAALTHHRQRVFSLTRARLFEISGGFFDFVHTTMASPAHALLLRWAQACMTTASSLFSRETKAPLLVVSGPPCSSSWTQPVCLTSFEMASPRFSPTHSTCSFNAFLVSVGVLCTQAATAVCTRSCVCVLLRLSGLATLSMTPRGCGLYRVRLSFEESIVSYSVSMLVVVIPRL